MPMRRMLRRVRRMVDIFGLVVDGVVRDRMGG